MIEPTEEPIDDSRIKIIPEIEAMDGVLHASREKVEFRVEEMMTDGFCMRAGSKVIGVNPGNFLPFRDSSKGKRFPRFKARLGKVDYLCLHWNDDDCFEYGTDFLYEGKPKWLLVSVVDNKYTHFILADTQAAAIAAGRRLSEIWDSQEAALEEGKRLNAEIIAERRKMMEGHAEYY